MKTKSNLRFTCPLCDKRIVVDDSLAGVTGPCPACGDTITVPLLDAEEDIPISSYDTHDDVNLSRSRSSERAPKGSHFLVKFLIAVIIALLIAFAVYYYLNSRA